MATNPPTGDGHRNGAVRKRSQVQNPKTKRWVKRNTETGRFLDQKLIISLSKVFEKKNNRNGAN